MSAEEKEKVYLLEFEGVYPNAMVYLNGEKIAECRYGYTAFYAPLEKIRWDKKNELRVEVDNTAQPNSRWYAGGGIFRPVWLLTGEKEHILPDGVRVRTLALEPARILVETDCRKQTETEIVAEIFFEGRKVAEGTGNAAEMEIPDAELWDEEHPYLYECRTTLVRDGRVLDEEKTRFGIRKLSWSPEGFFVNGKSVLLQGGCIHSDNGLLGARSYAKAEYRRIRRLKEAGFNAVRSAHNPLCRAALEACDALGMYVMDEAWDMWDKAKSPGDYAGDFPEHHDRDLVSMVRKDYNHPSVILYSIGNEVTEPAKPKGVELARRLTERLHELDASRPVTAGINLTLLLMAAMEHPPKMEVPEGVQGEDGMSSDRPSDPPQMNSTVYNQMVSEMGNSMTMAAAREEADQAASPVLDLLDIAGYNYAESRYEKDAVLHPDRLIVGTETYAYGLYRRWEMVKKLPGVIGDFMWTAWDYIGEAGIGGWSYDPEDTGFEKRYPWLLAEAGAFDILGNETAEAGAASIVWGARRDPWIGVSPLNHPGVTPSHAIWRGSNARPCWSYQGCEGNPAEIEIYSPGAKTELFLNGRSLGRKPLEEQRAVFETVYEPGELLAVSYDERGNCLGKSRLLSAVGKRRIRILPEEREAERGELCYVRISIVGENGQVEANRDTLLCLEVTGGELLAFGSANPKTEEDRLRGECRTYYGESLAVIRSLGGDIALEVSGNDLETEREVIPAGTYKIRESE